MLPMSYPKPKETVLSKMKKHLMERVYKSEVFIQNIIYFICVYRHMVTSSYIFQKYCIPINRTTLYMPSVLTPVDLLTLHRKLYNIPLRPSIV